MSESTLATRLAWTLVHFLWQGGLLGLVAWIVLTLLRRKQPEVRYAAACLFLSGCLALPGLTLLVQGVSAGPVSPAVAATATFRLLMGFRSLVVQWLPLLLVLWGLGSLGLGVRALGSWLWLRRLGRQALEVIDVQSCEMVDQLRQSLGIRAEVRLLESAKVRGPFVHGLLNPAILVPLGFIASMDPVALRAVLAHELAHIRRFDVLVIGLQTLIETLLYYHPVTWWLSHRVSAEREHCCDAFAVQACGDPVLFARTLSRLDALRESASPALAGGDLMERIMRILKRDPGPVSLPSPAFSFLLAISASALLASQPVVREAIAQVVVGTTGQRVGMEFRGLTAGIANAPTCETERPVAAVSNPESGILEPVAAKVLIPSTGLDTFQPLPYPLSSPIQATTSAVTPRKVSISALGLPFQKLFDVPIDRWDGNEEELNAPQLPGGSNTLATLFGRSDESGPYAFTHWPIPSQYRRRLVRVSLPASTLTTITVHGTSNTKQDEFFVLNAYRLQTLIGASYHLPQPTQGPRLLLRNASGIPQSVVILVTGPAKTPYHLRRAVTPLVDSAQKIVPEVPVERMPPQSWTGPTEVGRKQAQGLNRLWQGQQPTFKRSGEQTSLVWQSSLEILGVEELSELRCMEVKLEAGETARFRVTEGRWVHLEALVWPGESAAPWIQAVEEANATLQPSGQLDREYLPNGQFGLQMFMMVPTTSTKDLLLRNPTDQQHSCVLVTYRPKGAQGNYRIERGH